MQKSKSKIKSKKDISLLKISGRILKDTLDEVVANAIPDVKLKFLDQLAFDIISSYGAKPSFLGYQPEGAKKAFPASICASLGSVVVHGVPSNRTLEEGDVLKIDIGVDYQGYFTDAACTVIMGGKKMSAVKKLVKATEEALYAGIKEIKPGNRLGDIGFAISNVAHKYGVSVIEGLAGHGVGFAPHEDPLVFNTGNKGTGMLLEEGMVITLEPMFSLGSPQVFELPDGSFKTVDNSITAHFEHTIAVIRSGNMILTS